MDTNSPTNVNDDFKNIETVPNYVSFLDFGIARRTPLLNEKEVKKICQYLEKPTKIGIWTLKCKWDDFGGITGFINEKIKPLLAQETIELQDKKIKLKDEEKYELLENTKKFTFIYSLFIYLINAEKKEDTLTDYKRVNESYKLIFNFLDLEEIKQKYGDALAYFKENIYFENFNPLVKFNEILKNKFGTYVINDPNEDREVAFYRALDNSDDMLFGYLRNKSFISIEPEPLEKLKEFFIKIGKIEDPILMPIHSPEDEVFVPYFVFLEQTYFKFIDNVNIIERFRKAIAEYKNKDYSHCVNTIGLITEEYLIQIYETFFTNVCPKDLGMGQIFGLINSSINNKFKKVLEKAPDIKQLYDSINVLIKDNKSGEINKKTLLLLRKLVTYVNDDKKYILETINLHQEKEQLKSVFPKELIFNIKEVIKYRNATSHKSTDPIRRYEALRTVYGCIALIMWWNSEKRLIDWKENSEDRLKKSVERNSQLI
jgi:hypothetical protein